MNVTFNICFCNNSRANTCIVSICGKFKIIAFYFRTILHIGGIEFFTGLSFIRISISYIIHTNNLQHSLSLPSIRLNLFIFKLFTFHPCLFSPYIGVIYFILRKSIGLSHIISNHAFVI